MAEEKAKAKSLKLKKEAAETPERREKDGGARKDSVRSSFGKNLVKVGKELGKSNGREAKEEEVKSASKAVKKEEAKSPVKVGSKGAGSANGKEQAKSSKDAGKVNGKSAANASSGKGLVKVKAEDKGKSAVVKSSPVKPGSASKLAKVGASSSAVKKIVKTETKVTTKIVTDVKKEKKVYSLPGQKHDPPEERDALRIFYSTLREQIPESEMAEIWLMEYGLLPPNEAQKAFERKQRLRGQPVRSGTTTKSSTPSRASNGSPALKKSTPVSNGKGKGKVIPSSSKGKKKRDASDSDSDEESLAKSVTKKKLKAESDSDDDFLASALPSRKKLKK